jgi:DNA polymerase-4
MAVCGSKKQRHGIVLAANYHAKRYGIKTAMSSVNALKMCPGLYTVPPHYDDYLQFSGFARSIYSQYSDRIEAFGLDENWLDLTGCVTSLKQGAAVIHEIRERVKRELGITVSIGLSFNKVFAKLGSDYKKPDACTVISKENFKEVVWPLPVGELLYVGRATEEKLRRRNIKTIGDLANTNPESLKGTFGKVIEVLHSFANGKDMSMVTPTDFEAPVKSVGNSFTAPRDLKTDEDVRIMLYSLSESVGARLAELRKYASTIEFSYVNSDMTSHASRQKKLEIPTNISGEIADTAFGLFKRHYSHWPSPLRKVGVTGSGLLSIKTPRQLTVWENAEQVNKKEDFERTVNALRARYGNNIVQRAVMLTDRQLSGMDAKRDNKIHPVGVFYGGMSESWGVYQAAATQ